MFTGKHYQNSLLILSYLLMHSDGVLEDSEINALERICVYEQISKQDLDYFISQIQKHSEKEIYDMGIEEVSFCSDEDKVRAFAWLHRISEADGNVHVKEVRFLLYSIKKAEIDFKNVLEVSSELPSLV